ncbi:MAG: arginine--tRNA ligase [Nanoarchaeota archaeon]
MDIFKKHIISLLKKSVTLNEKDIIAILEVPPNPSFGDYSLPCFLMAKDLKKNPNEIAFNLTKLFSKDKYIEKVECKGAYVNFFINKSKFNSMILKEILKLKEKYGFNKTKKEKIVIEYPSPNTNKPLHLGHVRNMLIGQSVSNILKFNNQNVIQVNLNNDRGVHICKSMLAYKKYGNNKKPNKKNDHFVGDYYVLYSENAKQHPELELEIQDMLLKWEKNNPEVLKLWKLMNSWAIKGFNETYKLFNIKFDKIYNESDHYKRGKSIVLNAYRKKLFEKDENDNICVNLEKYNLPNKILLRKDGTSVYITQDIGLAKVKYDDFKMNKSVYVVGSEQNLHFKQLFKILDMLKFKNVKGLIHLSYGMIYLPEGKMKSREGTVVDADDLVEKIKNLALEEVKKRYKLSKDEAEKRAFEIGMAGLRYLILKYDAAKDFVFNPNETISFEGDTGPYIQYTYARASSILRKTKFDKKVDFSLLKESKENELIKILSNFPRVVNKASRDFKPNYIANYSYELAQKFNEFYHSCPVIHEDEELKNARCSLVLAFTHVIKTSLSLLGINVLEEM